MVTGDRLDRKGSDTDIQAEEEIANTDGTGERPRLGRFNMTPKTKMIATAIMVLLFILIVGGASLWFMGERSQRLSQDEQNKIQQAISEAQQNKIKKLVAETLDEYTPSSINEVEATLREHSTTNQGLIEDQATVKERLVRLEEVLKDLQAAQNGTAKPLAPGGEEATKQIQEFAESLKTLSKQVGLQSNRLTALEIQRDRPAVGKKEIKRKGRPADSAPTFTLARIDRWDDQLTPVFRLKDGRERSVTLGGSLEKWRVISIAPEYGEVAVGKGKRTIKLTTE